MEDARKFLSPQRKAELQAFVQLLQKHPEILHAPELAFFAEYLVSLGAKIPPKPAPAPAPEPEPEPAPAAAAPPQPQPKPKPDVEMPDARAAEEARQPQQAASPEAEPEEKEPEEAPDPDLMEPDSDDKQLEMGDRTKEVSEADIDAANEIKARAMAIDDDAEGVRLLTQAILRNPRSAILFASRAALLLRMKRPNAAVRDCDAAIALNPDSAKPYKVRGKALRYLGKYEQARRDLQMGNKLDFDEATFEVQKWVEARLKAHDEYAARMAARQREREEARRQREREEAEQRRKQRAAQQQQEEQQKAEAGDIPAGMGFLNDPEVIAAMQDPETQAKLMEILQSGNPAKFMEAQKDPKLARILAKIIKGAQGMHTGGGGANVPPGMFNP